MPYCTNCENEVGKTHYYCGQCGDPLTEETDRDGVAPGSTAQRTGFLSGRTIEYLNDVLEEGIDEDHPGHTHLERDIAAALVDFGMVGAIDELNLLEVLASGSQDDFLDDTESELMYLGFLRLVRLYDQSIGTDWEDELSDRLTTAVEKAKEELDEDPS